jgi:hypothetical protein
VPPKLQNVSKRRVDISPENTNSLSVNDRDFSGRKINGEFVRTVTKHGFKGDIMTVLLKDVKDETGINSMKPNINIIQPNTPILGTPIKG